MIENPDNIAEQVQNLNERVAKVSDNHLARIRDLSNRIDNLKTASARQILEIFYTLRTDVGSINGAYDCNGQVFHKDDFAGEQNPYELLVQGKAPTCSFAEYAEEVSTKGSCGKFALDEVGRKFKVPTLTNILQPTVLASEIGKLVEAGLPNITGKIPGVRRMDTLHDSEYDNSALRWLQSTQYLETTTTTRQSASPRDVDPILDASHENPIYGNSNTVQPQTIYARAMVQLATSGQEVSIQQYEQQLSDYARTNTINGRLIGEIIQSALPLTDAGVHLLDGSQIQKSGIYAQFCTYVAGLQADYPDLFCTEAEFTASVEAYGSCGKFVNGASYIRLPKVSDILQGTTDLTAVGDLVEAGLPNITGLIQVPSYGASGAFERGTSQVQTGSYYNGNSNYPQTFDASRSSPYYRNDVTKPTPQTIKALLYICVATAIKTPVEVNIDNIITDNNNKADKDFANVTKPYVVEEWHQGTEWYRVWSTGFIEQGGYITFTGYEKKVTLNKEFTNTNYSVFITPCNQTNYAYGAGSNTKLVGSFNARGALYSGGSIGIESNWKAEGY